jgi:hypothetical protein
VVYPNQRQNVTLLNSKPYSGWRFYLGGPEGIPDFMIIKANVIFGCPNLELDGRFYTRATEGSQFEFREQEDYPMRGWNIELRYKFNRSGKVFITDGSGQANRRLRVAANVEALGFVTNDNGGSFFQVPDIGG